MINPVRNYSPINFKGSCAEKELQFDDIERMFKARDAKRAKMQQEQRQMYSCKKTRPYSEDKYTKKCTPKRNKNKAPVRICTLLGAGALLLTLGTKSCTIEQNQYEKQGSRAAKTEKTIEIEQPQIDIEIEIEESPYSKEEIQNAVETIKSDEDLKVVYYNMIKTIENMSETFDNPIETINEILEQPYAHGVDIEFVLTQIFCESSGCHYDESGQVLSSWADCNGFMQVGKGVEHDINEKYFSTTPQDRDNPLGNLKLGIAYDSYLKTERFKDDFFNAVAAYNCGPANASSGNYCGADKYARTILNHYEILKNNPLFTQMLLDGVLNEYRDEFLYF